MLKINEIRNYRLIVFFGIKSEEDGFFIIGRLAGRANTGRLIGASGAGVGARGIGEASLTVLIARIVMTGCDFRTTRAEGGVEVEDEGAGELRAAIIRLGSG